MICYNSRAADQYAHQQGLEAELEALAEEAFNNAFSEVPEAVMEVLRRKMAEDRQFCEALETAALNASMGAL